MCDINIGCNAVPASPRRGNGAPACCKFLFFFLRPCTTTSYTVNPLISCRPTEYVGLHHVVRLTIKPALSWPGSCSILPCR